MTDGLRYLDAPPLALRVDAGRRQIAVRLFEWDRPGQSPDGPELIERGALDGVDLESVVTRMDHLDPPIGGLAELDTRSDKAGPLAVLQIAQTARGDEALQLAQAKIYKGVSVGFTLTPPDEYRNIGGERTAIRKTLDLREVSLTWRPAHPGASILAIRAEDTGMTEDTKTTPAADAEQPAAPAAASTPAAAPVEGDIRNLLDRLDQRMVELDERMRRDVDVPGVSRPRKPGETKGLVGRWVRAALTVLSGEKVSDIEVRALADVITADNLGVVPKNIHSELIGIIDPARPFLQSTRKVDAGDSGMVQTFPRLTQRPIVGVQGAEKAELASQKTIIGTVDFGVTTIGGAGDLSIQLLKRSSPAFLQLWLDLLAEQYAIMSDDKAVDALLAAGVQAGTGVFNPETFKFGEAFTNSAEVSPGLQLRPDHMWLSTAAFVSMIDARTPAGGGLTPMYPGLVQIDGVTSNPGGGPLPLRLAPVLVPALDDEAVDVVIGPSRGFAWAEDGTYELQADVPSKAGKDVGLVGMIWYMPVYPAAFTTYSL